MANSGSAISSALTTAFAGIQTDVTAGIGAALPYALSVMGLILAIGIVVKVYKKITR